MFLTRAEMCDYNIDHEDMDVGEQRHVDHSLCPAGTDTKRRLFIKRTRDGMLFYCHHCSCKGFLRTSREPKRISESMYVLESPTIAATSKLPSIMADSAANIDDWPTDVKLWWYSYEMDQNDALRHNVRWHSAGGRLMLPALNALTQGRAFYGRTPKYLTWNQCSQVILYAATPKRKVYVVEDLLSAYKLDKAGLNVCCLTGTTMDDMIASTLVSMFDHVVLWLDTDLAGYSGAVRIRSELSPLVTTTILSMHQPKEIPLSKLKEASYA
jgi:hypothetical protein